MLMGSEDRWMTFDWGCVGDRPISMMNILVRSRRSTLSHLTNYSEWNYSDASYEYFDSEEESGCNPVFFLLDFFHEYYIPFIILLGFVGNLLSCVVFLNTHLKMRSSSYYLAALACADFGFLVALLCVWLNNVIGWPVFNKDGWCEILVYLSSVCSSLSVWLIVAFTVERFIAVQYPLHRPQMCTIARAKTIVLVLVFVAFAIHTYAFFTAGIIHKDGQELCSLKPDWWRVMRVINIIDSVISLIVPLVLIVAMNTMITRNLLHFSRRFRNSPEVSEQSFNQNRSDSNQMPSGSNSNNGVANIPLGVMGARKQLSQPSSQSSKNKPSRNQASLGIPMPSTPKNVQQIQEISTRCIHIRSSSRNLVSTRNQQSITKMLLLISTVFILLNLPSYVVRLCVFFFTLARKEAPALLWCIQQFFMLLYYTNFSINFLLYAMCGITFRRCLEQLLRKALKRMTRYLEKKIRSVSESS